MIHKFRAWMKDERKMRNVFCIYPDSNLFEVDGIDEEIGTDRAVLMECSGFADMFGAPVYEGDIFMQRFYYKDGICIDSYGVVKIDANDGGFSPMTGGEYGLPSYDMEIIGNIYENPDLPRSGQIEYKTLDIPKYGHSIEETEKAIRSHLNIK